MQPEDFFNDSDVHNYVNRAKILNQSNKKFSDIIDKNGYQYVDLVQEGGGILGIALIGYTYILEKAGIRFFNLAGASAGAINTIFMSSIKDITSEKSEKVLSALLEQNLFDFVDGGSFVKKMVTRFTSDKSVLGTVFWNIFKLEKKIVKNMGLNPGKKFEDWITAKLAENGIVTLRDMKNRMADLPEFFNTADGNSIPQKYDSILIAIVATDATTKTKVEFPRMAPLYWESENISPAYFVRASMSIPMFFEPFTVKDVPGKGGKQNPFWQDMAGYYGVIPDEIKFVDGGLISNFPINIFHRDGIPNKPTFGVRLSAYREETAKTDHFGGFVGGMLDALRQQFDFDFLLRHPDYKKLICKLDADKTYNWLDFNIPDDSKLGLFKLGASRAIDFLEKFDWGSYKNIRKALITAPISE